jgi:hypothetical protein
MNFLIRILLVSLLAASPVAANATFIANGTQITAATMPSGGVGLIGWMSAIWYQLTQVLSSNTAQVNGVTTSTGTGAAGTGTQRVAVGTDTATIAGSAPGTAGTPSANVVTIQGASSMTPLATADPPVAGFGVVAATNASALLSTLTLGPNSAVWPTTPGILYVINSGASAGIVHVCPLAGTCVAAGLPIAPGGYYKFNKPSTSMTIIADSTASVSAQW